MADLNLYVAWTGILLGLLTGIPLGLGFHDEGWLGGYNSWRRRLLRLGHIALFGTAFLNLALWLTVQHRDLAPPPLLASVLLAAGAATMPAVCFLAAWRKPLRQLFFIPVLCLAGGTLDFILRGLMP